MQNKGTVDGVNVIGLTGGVGAGKSLVLSILKNKYDAQVIEADQVAQELMMPGEEGFSRVVAVFGDKILNSDGTLNRTELGNLIFQDEKARLKVNSIIHPLVWKTISQKISASQAGLIVVEFAIMGEETKELCDELCYVHASEENRITRLFENRGYTRERSVNMIKSQASEQEFLECSDRVIENNGSVKELENQLAELLKIKGQGTV